LCWIEPSDLGKGTLVTVAVVAGRVPQLPQVFAEYTDPEDWTFDRTRTTVWNVFSGTFLRRPTAGRHGIFLENPLLK